MLPDIADRGAAVPYQAEDCYHGMVKFYYEVVVSRVRYITGQFTSST